jgi:aldehyde:ferredoxin oxidoreductase
VDEKAIGAYWIARKACAACPIGCARKTQVGAGEDAIVIEGPEYETTDALGPMCWNGDPEVVIRANHLCNEYGLDTISTGVTIAFAMECHQRGLLDDPELSLEWGDRDTILGLIERIAYRQGLGDMLAEGTHRAARQIGHGAEEFAMQVKGLEMPRQEPRRAKGFGLGHSTSNRGADHLYALPTLDLSGNWEAARKIFPEAVLGQLMNVADETYKPDIVVYSEHFCAIADSLGVCKFSTPETYAVMVDELAAGLRALGYDLSGPDLLEIGERIVNLERLYNVRHGLSRRDDVLPRRFTEETLKAYVFSTDKATGEVVHTGEPVDTGVLINLQPMLTRYYALRGWDDDGVPAPATLERLKLARFAGGVQQRS